MTASEPSFIVGIGASAGGLEALQKLLSALPCDTGFPYIIVQHLSPDYQSLLSQILGKYTKMPVRQAEEGMEIAPDQVYIIRPGKLMTLQSGCLHMTDQVQGELNLPIDAFFRSLSAEAGARAIAVVLSGTGSDGTNGIKAVKECDGMVIAQTPESAKFDGMPRSAIHTGLVDAQFTPEEIAMELGHISGVAKRASDKAEPDIDEDLMQRAYAALKKACGVDFTHYKQSTLARRMQRRMLLTRHTDLRAYIDFLRDTPEEARVLGKEALIGVTSFFRDPECFDALKEKALYDILARSTPEEQIRVWVAGCSTGEEAYSVAILFTEAMETLGIRRTVKIFATDLDAEAIETAGRGLYGDSIANAVSPARLIRRFIHQGGAYAVSRDIRRMIIFSPHNVFQDPPFGRLDLICCRNMMIYFQPVLQADLFSIFHQSLKDGGYLFLGKSETVGAFTDAFPPVDAAAKVYTHRRDARVAVKKRVTFMPPVSAPEDADESPDARIEQKSAPRGARSVSETLLQRFIPAGLVVNADNEIIHTYGALQNYAHFSVGRFSGSLFDVLTEGLKIPASTLLKQARLENAEKRYDGIRFMGEREREVVDMTALPVGSDKTDGACFALVLTPSHAGAPVGETPDMDEIAARRITDLEQELSESQDRLRRSVSEQECVSEELQAANEELLTANEELQSSNEELQSVNEELYTVNAEYQEKLGELASLNDDIANFLTSTLTGIIFVDEQLNIRRYTDYVTAEFSVMDHDIGRSLTFISYHFPETDVADICKNVLKTLVPDEREVVTRKGKTFFLRVAPYRSTENKILGCVLTLVDITSQKRDTQSLHRAEKQLALSQDESTAKSDYLSRVAHEIRTPMSSLMLLSGRAQRDIDDRAALADDLYRIADTVGYLTSIVTDMAEASVSERLAGERALEPFTLQSALDSVLAIIGRRAQENGVTLEARVAPGGEGVYAGNKTKVQQILTGFIGNAVKSIAAGGAVRVTADEESASGGRARVRFVISQPGAGSESAPSEQAAKPASRRPENDENAHASMGLGLSIAYHLIDSMDGDVTVDGGEGAGSTLVIRLMLERRGDAEADAAPKEYQLQGLHLLVAEDNALNRTILCALLTSEGMTFKEVGNGRDALEAFTQSPDGAFSCVLMDVRMPVMDGVAAASAIRQSGRADAYSVPIIAISANGAAEDVQKARAAGMNEYVTKPIDRDRLLSAIQRLARRA